MPGVAELRSTPERTLLRDYWARRFEGELARAWQLARDDNQDQRRFGPESLAKLIGQTGLAEALKVLTRDGVPGAREGAAALCRAFVARTVRLRYFAPGTRGCHFPAVPDWSALDRWIEESGLDLPPPRTGARLPILLERSRPSSACGAPACAIPLPASLSFGRADPDRPATPAGVPNGREAYPDDRARTAGAPTALEAPAGPAPLHLQTLEARCLDALHRGAKIRRRPGWPGALAERLAALLRPLLRRLLRVWDLLPLRHFARPPGPGRLELQARLYLLGSAFGAAQRAELDGRYGRALRHLRDAREQYRGLAQDDAAQAWPESAAERLLEQRHWAAAESLADTLSVAARLPGTLTQGLGEAIARLAAETGPESATALSLLRQLERALLEGRATYYRIDLRAWLAGGRATRVLPFQGTLKGLRALDTARRLLEDLPWPVADLDRLAAPLAALAERQGERLEQQLGPHLRDALAAAGFVPESPSRADRIALRRLADTLGESIRNRWSLRFSDVRDLLARDILALPDARPSELLHGDRLTRFDRAAAQALPGVYRRGEPYVKGLQRLGAPVFGTAAGRWVLRLAIGPWLVAYLGLMAVGLIWGLVMPGPIHPHLTSPAAVLALTVALSLATGTGVGRHVALGLWHALARPVRYLLGPGPGRVLRRLRRRVLYWGPAAWLLDRRLVRGLHDRLLAPLATGLVPLLPALVPLWLLTPEGPGQAPWIAVLAVAFALGTLLRDTPGGRRWLDDLATGWRRSWVYLRHEGLKDLADVVMGFFKAQTRRLTEALSRVRSLLDRRLGEPLPSAALKTLATPVWGALEAVIQFYAVVLIEPQTNPIKHFPVVTLGHKLLLPFLPALGTGLAALLSPVLPAAVALPLVTLTLFLLPGLFGFLFWELKENRRLYAANRSAAVPEARLGAHGETLKGLLRRGLHGGTLPKAFDRLRQSLERQVREGAADPRALRRAALDIKAIADLLARFAELDLALPLREGFADGAGALRGVEVEAPRLTIQTVELKLRLYPTDGNAPFALLIRLTLAEPGLRCETRLECPTQGLPEAYQDRIAESVAWFARRCGADLPPDGLFREKPQQTQ